MPYYLFTLDHNRGTVRVGIYATSLTSAVRHILKIENAPFRSIKKIEKH